MPPGHSLPSCRHKLASCVGICSAIIHGMPLSSCKLLRMRMPLHARNRSLAVPRYPIADGRSTCAASPPATGTPTKRVTTCHAPAKDEQALHQRGRRAALHVLPQRTSNGAEKMVPTVLAIMEIGWCGCSMPGICRASILLMSDTGVSL
eukprot:scaffold6691_cov358-Prasinococcus_capsulatus_cf.AAC.6